MQEDDKQNDKIFRKRVIMCVVGACIVIAFYFCIYRWSGLSKGIGKAFTVFQPIIIGFCMAFLMNPIMNFFEKHLSRPFHRLIKSETKAAKFTRTISSVLALLVLVGLVAAFMAIVVPELISTITYLANHIETQIAGVLDWCNEITGGRYEDSLMRAKENKIEDALDTAVEWIENYLNYDEDELFDLITSSVITVIKIVVNIIIGMFVSVYVLMSRETFKGQAKKIVYGLFRADQANIILEVSRKSGDIFYGFIIGKIVDSIIIGILCYIGCIIMQMPYAVLVSVIIGVTNIIPVFGPYIGAVPTVIIIFLTSPMQGIYFLIFVLILQQFDGNVLGPKILGDSTGISSFWVVFAVVVGAGLLGVPGMILGVPLMAIIYYLISRHSRFILGRKGLPTDTTDYVCLDKIDTTNNEPIMLSEEKKNNKHKIGLFKGFKHKKKD